MRVLLLVVVCVASVGALNKGDGTAYSGTGEKDATGFNACQFGQLDDRWEEYYAALPSQVFDRDRDCGRCISVRGTEPDAPQEWVKLMVVDECASCGGDGDVDMSISGLKDASGYAWDRKRVEWKFSSCDGDGGGDSGDGDGEGKRRKKKRRKHRKHSDDDDDGDGGT